MASMAIGNHCYLAGSLRPLLEQHAAVQGRHGPVAASRQRRFCRRQPDPEAIAPPASAPLTATASLRQLLDSLSREQRRNGELLASLGFALRSFTNLSRFLELVALVAARLVEAEGALLVVFHPDGRLWREQLQASPPDRCAKLLRQIAALADSDLQAQASEEAVVQLLDQLVARLLGEVQVFGTSVVARSNQRGRLYVFSGPDGLCWSEVNQRHIQLVADLTGVALENELLLADMRRHERLDRQLSSGAEIQAQLLPDHCPVIEGVELAARCRPAFQVGRRLLRLHPHPAQLLEPPPRAGRWALVMGDVMGKGCRRVCS